MPWNRTKVAGGLLGALVVAGAIIYYNWDATPRLSGDVTQVRTLGMDGESSVAIINFVATNTSNYEISVRSREMEILDAEGNVRQGKILSVYDTQQLFKYFPALGGMGDEPLTDNRVLAPGASLRGLAAARFEIPKHKLDERQEIVLRTLDVKHRPTALRMVTK